VFLLILISFLEPIFLKEVLNGVCAVGDLLFTLTSFFVPIFLKAVFLRGVNKLYFDDFTEEEGTFSFSSLLVLQAGVELTSGVELTTGVDI